MISCQSHVAGLLAALVWLAAAHSSAAQPASAQPAPDSARYAVQVRATSERAVVAQMLDSLRQRHVPAYVAAAEGGPFRLRIGPFTSDSLAQRYVQVSDWPEAWVVDAAADAGPGRAVTHVRCDTLYTRGQETYVYLGRFQPLLVVLQRSPGGRRSLLPSQMRMYAAGAAQPVVVEDVTGFLETEGAVEFGQAERVYVNPQRKSEEALRSEVQAFSEAYGVSPSVIRVGMALYNDNRVARFTLRKAVDLRRGAVVAYAQPGLDYAGFGGTQRRFTGTVAPEGRFRRGNVRAEPVPTARPFARASDFVTLRGRPLGEQGGAVSVCALFFAERPDPVAAAE